MCNNIVEEKAEVEKQNSKKGFEKNETACSVEGVLWVLDSTACPYLKVAGRARPDSENSNFKASQSSDSSKVTCRNSGYAAGAAH